MDIEAFPLGFYCQHEEDASSVFALVVMGDRQPALTKILDIGDASLAHRVACVFNGLRVTSSAPALDEEVADVERLLPEEDRAAYRAATQQLIHRMWPSPRMSPRDIFEGPADRFHDTEDEEARSPEEARLAEIPGSVVRIWRLTELHVFDAQRALHAASATGRTGVGMRGEPTKEETLVDAVAVLLDEERGIPGADNIFDRYIGMVLDPAEDELADFRSVGSPEFTDTGWRADEPRRRTPPVTQ